MSHTPEPWSYEHGNGHHSGSIVITSFTMSAKSPLAVISDICGDAEQDARRIVACVNACKGISTKTLEHANAHREKLNGINTAYEIAANERDTYRDLCAELIEKMREIKMIVNSPLEAYYIASDAITKAESILGEGQ